MSKGAVRMAWRRPAVAIAVAAGTVLAGPFGAVPEAAAQTMVNCATDDLQDEIDNAAPGSTLTLSGTCTGAFTVDRNLTLVAASAGSGVSGGGSARPLTINSGIQVSLIRLTVSGGNAGDGGGIHNSGSLSLNRVAVTGNTSSGLGGGIANVSGASLSVNRSSVTSNSAVFGGGIGNFDGAVQLNQSTVNSNQSQFGGGGIGSTGTGLSTVSLNGSTVNGNVVFAESQGGGINNDAGSLRLNRSTITNNSVGNNMGGTGGGVFNRGPVSSNRTSIVNNFPNNCAGSTVPVPGCVN